MIALYRFSAPKSTTFPLVARGEIWYKKDMRSLKVLLLATTFCLLFTISKAAPSYAADPNTVVCSIFKTNESVWQAINNPRWVTDTFTSVLVGPATIAISGSDLGTVCECTKKVAAATDMNTVDSILKQEPCSKAQVLFGSSGMGLAANYTAALFDTSESLISTKYYANDILENGVLAKSAYAANTDHWALLSILDVWKTLRNISYVMFVLVFVILGFMIMFRKKIDPQTVVTIQNALPRVVIALVLITFSYPIASLIFNTSPALTSLVKSWFYPVSDMALAQAAFISVLAVVVGALLMLTGPFGIAVGILIIILSAALVVGLLYLAFTLLTRLGKLVVLTTASPFILLIGAIPGNEKTIINWFKSLLSLTLQIPAIWFILYMSLYLITYLMPYGQPTEHWLGIGGDVPVFGIIAGPFLGVWLLYQTGKATKLVDEALGVEPLFGGGDRGKKGKK